MIPFLSYLFVVVVVVGFYSLAENSKIWANSISASIVSLVCCLACFLPHSFVCLLILERGRSVGRGSKE
jgi:hypothetical protein